MSHRNLTGGVPGAVGNAVWVRRARIAGTVCAVAFVVVTVCVVGRPGNALDHRILTASPGTQDWAAARWMIRGRILGEPNRALPLGVVMTAAGLAFRRTRRATLLAGATFFTGVAVGTALKYGLGQSGPPVTDGSDVDNGTAFPSGHTVISSLLYPCAAAVVATVAPRRSIPVIAAGGVAIPAVVGLCQTLLRTHWASDVVGAWLFSAAWLGLAVVVIDRLAPPWWVRPDTAPVGRRRPTGRHL